MNKDISIFDDHQALWESWYPLREESEEWIRICALTPIGEVRIMKYHLGLLWDVYPSWEAHKDSGVSEQEAIEKAIESYVRSLKRVTREYIKGLRVHLGRMCLRVIYGHLPQPILFVRAYARTPMATLNPRMSFFVKDCLVVQVPTFMCGRTV